MKKKGNIGEKKAILWGRGFLNQNKGGILNRDLEKGDLTHFYMPSQLFGITMGHGMFA